MEVTDGVFGAERSLLVPGGLTRRLHFSPVTILVLQDTPPAFATASPATARDVRKVSPIPAQCIQKVSRSFSRFPDPFMKTVSVVRCMLSMSAEFSGLVNTYIVLFYFICFGPSFTPKETSHQAKLR